MTLDYLCLDNFGAYCGRQEAHLTPEEGRPVILFGGMNGGGKTTLLDALQLALYGSKAKLSNRGRMGYRDYLRDCINRNADPGEGAGVILRFRRTVEGKVSHFELQRTWRMGVKGIEETLRVLRDGERDDLFTDHWDEVIDSYLPRAMICGKVAGASRSSPLSGRLARSQNARGETRQLLSRHEHFHKSSCAAVYHLAA